MSRHVSSMSALSSAVLVLVATLAVLPALLPHAANGQTVAPFVGNVAALSGVGGLSGDNTVASPAIPLTSAQYSDPTAIVAGNTSNIIYVADQRTVRELDSVANTARVVAGQRARTGNVDGPATTTALLGTPAGLAQYNGTIYIADKTNHNIRMLKDGIVTRIAGSGAVGNANGAALIATFNNPTSLLIHVTDPTKLYVVEGSNNAIRLINLATNMVSTVLTINSPQSIAMSADAEFLVIGYVDSSTRSDSIMMYTLSTGVERVLRTALAAPPLGIVVDAAKNIIFTQFSFVALFQASTDFTYMSVTSGSGLVNGEFTAAKFNGLGDISATSDYNYAFVEGAANFDVRTMSLYPRDVIIPWFINVTALFAPTNNATVMSALYTAALDDLVGVLNFSTDITTGSPYVGQFNDNGVFLQFNAPAFANNASSRAAVAASNFTLSKAVTSWFATPQTLKIHFPSATVPTNNATVIAEFQASLLADMVAMLGYSEGVSIKTNYTTMEGTGNNEVAFYVEVPAFIHNDTTNDNLKTYAFPNYTTTLDTFNAPRPLSLVFDASQFNFPLSNMSVLEQIATLLNTELQGLTGVNPASTFNLSSFTESTVTSTGGVTTKVYVVTGSIPGAIENATTTAALKNTTYAPVTTFLTSYYEPKLISLAFPDYFIPASTQDKMTKIQEAYLLDLLTIFNASNPNVTLPSFLTSFANGSSDFVDLGFGEGLVGLRAYIPGEFYNTSSEEAFASSEWSNLYTLLNSTSDSSISFGLDPATVSGDQIPMNGTLVEARRMWATGVEPGNLATTIALMEQDLRDYYGYPVTVTGLRVTPNTTYSTDGTSPIGSLVGASYINWTIQFPFSADREGKPVHLAPFPSLFAYLGALITAPPSREVVGRGVAPATTFFGDSCTIGCVIGVAIAIAAVIAIIVVIIVLIVARRKRKANVIAPSFNPMAKNPMAVGKMQLGEEGGMEGDIEDVEMA